MDKVASVRSAPSGRRMVRAAQYLRMSTEHQTYSTDNQKDAIRDYADIMGYDIVATYEDVGRSGLKLGGRPGLQQLLADVESGTADFETVVVYDVSRWGRFQNIDESAAYEYRCQMAGVRIEFCAEQFANDGSIGSDVLKAIKRSMAAEHSRMLSQKVFLGQVRLIRMGFRQGAKAGLGLRRLLVDQQGHPKGILSSHEYKSLQTDRIVLVPGPPGEIATVRWIFDHFVKTRKTELQIARLLNKRSVLTDRGRPWTRESMHSLLTNENYIGNSVWNRSSTRLKGCHVSNPPEQWVRAENVLEPIVDRKVFSQAQAILKTIYRHMTNEEMLAALKALLARRGALSASIVDAAPDCPPSTRYHSRFGSIVKAYELIGYQPPKSCRFIHVNRRLETMRQGAIQDLMAAFEKCGAFATYDTETDLLRINHEITVAIAVGRCRVSGLGYPRWFSRADHQPTPDIFVLIRMNPGDLTIRDYLIAPACEIAGKRELHADNGARLDSYLFPTLEPLVALAERVSVEGAL
ncbi:recombinase family protein [Mesorhizobium sp. WSM4884]|uniref:recombinase family protein n=1 Tax=Mesorhizobium sp. WSM4884 TaxID=3038542 RepID=UPI002417A232|nr:recombinase family protein [Mesorhizobium sp. WSM4884]MDG4881979.1 recombinase family protein [Mesorhizobium sp. WSM4884]